MRRFASYFSCLFFAFAATAGEFEDNLQRAVDAGELDGLHAVHVIMGGEVISDAYFASEDQNWGRPLGVVQHSASSLHDLRSVSKSITSLLYGIALDKGLVPDVQAPLLAQFPQYNDLAGEAARDAVTIEDALTMRMGMEWDETLPYTDPRNSEIAMENAPDRLRFILSRPMITEPGNIWTYSGGATAIIGALIEQGSGADLDDFAKEHLFDPLGITNFGWNRGRDGIPSAASGLRLAAPDLAKIGQMIINQGEFEGRQIVSASWLDQTLSAKTSTGFGLDYGYFWYMPPDDPPAWTAGFGNGGQRFSINADLELVVVIYAGNYNTPDDWKLAVKVIEEHLTPVIRAKIAED